MPPREVAFAAGGTGWHEQQVVGTVGSTGDITVYLWVYHEQSPRPRWLFDNAELWVHDALPFENGRVAGVVYDATGAAREDVAVQLDPGGVQASTFSNGYFVFDNVSPATYTVSATVDNLPLQVTNLAVEAGQTAIADLFVEELSLLKLY